MSDTSLNHIIQYGTDADRIAFTPDPAVGSQVLYFWYVTDDTPNLYIWDGSAWVLVNPVTSTGIDQLTGDVTAGPGSGSQAATIPNDTVTYAKMQNVSAADKLLGRGHGGGSGDVQEITLGTNLSMTGTTLDAASGSGITTLTGDVTAGPGSGSQAATIANNAVTYAKIQDISATARILGRKTSGAGDTEECTLSDILDFLGSAAQGDILYRGASGWSYLAPGTSGQFLKTQGAGADPVWATVSGGGSGFTIIQKAADQTILNSTTFTNDADFVFSVAANKIYYFELSLRLSASSGAADFKFQWVLPSGASVEWDAIYLAGATNKWDNTQTTATPVSLSTSTQTTGSNALQPAAWGTRFRGFIVVGANAGSAQFQWAQNTADNTSPGNTIKKGASLAYSAGV